MNLDQAYTGNPDGIVEVTQGEFGITHALDAKPVLATADVSCCVGFIGWEPRLKIGFMAHYDGMTLIPASVRHLKRLLQKLTGERQHYSAFLFGGTRTISESLVDAVRRESALPWKNLEIEITAEDLFRPREDRFKLHMYNAAIDTRTGEITGYDAYQNPRRRRITEPENFHMQCSMMQLDSPAVLHYFPKRR